VRRSGADPRSSASRRARRLLRWYPAAWRARYGEEFTELLMSDIEERPRSRVRALDVARGGLVARLTGAGLCGVAFDPGRQVRASLISLGCCLAVFLGFAAAVWSQLATGWQWSQPARPATVAMVATSAAMLAFAALAVLACGPVIVSAVSCLAEGQSKGPNAPSVVLLTSLVILVIGGRHFGNGWPGTGGPHHGLVPAGVAAFSWASTLWVSSYWAHPAALAAFPPAELAWMAVSPLVLACMVCSAALLVRRSEFSPRNLLRLTRLATAACLAMAVFLGGCLPWVLGGGAGTGSPFHAGAIDTVALGVMAVALGIARRAAAQARLGGARLVTR
jgi:hypothetical protein